MLLRREMPSWLYQVEQGATTVWERWDAILPDGSIHSGAMSTPPDMPAPEGREPHMLSFNHYAYGAVIDWVYRHVAGIAPDPARPGLSGGRVRARAGRRHRLGARLGRQPLRPGGHRLAHRRRRESLAADIELPFGTLGHVRGTGHVGRRRSTVDGAAGGTRTTLGPGRHHVTRVGAPDRRAHRRDRLRRLRPAASTPRR